MDGAEVNEAIAGDEESALAVNDGVDEDELALTADALLEDNDECVAANIGAVVGCEGDGRSGMAAADGDEAA